MPTIFIPLPSWNIYNIFGVHVWLMVDLPKTYLACFKSTPILCNYFLCFDHSHTSDKEIWQVLPGGQATEGLPQHAGSRTTSRLPALEETCMPFWMSPNFSRYLQRRRGQLKLIFLSWLSIIATRAASILSTFWVSLCPHNHVYHKLHHNYWHDRACKNAFLTKRFLIIFFSFANPPRKFTI